MNPTSGRRFRGPALPDTDATCCRRRVFALLFLMFSGAAPIGVAQAQTTPVTGPVALPDSFGDDIVVTARRDAPDGPETELGEEEIARYGANTIADLLRDVGPLIDGTGKAPILLVNGKRIGSASGIAGFPPEALARLAILPPAAAARYGYPADQRVVNLVLKNRFSSWETEGGLTLATAGGRDSERFSVGRVVIDGSTYWNAQIQASRDSMLLRSARPNSSLPQPVDLDGHVAGIGGRTIDPALDLLAGRDLTTVDFPAVAFTRPPTLADFAAAAARGFRSSNPDDAYALLPGGGSLAVNLGVTRPVGTFTASFNLTLNRVRSIQRLGYPEASLALPAQSPWSPFSGTVLLIPDLANVGPLETRQGTTSLGLSASLTGAIAGWNANLLVDANQSWSDSRFDRGADLSDLQRRLDALDPSFDPCAPLPSGLVDTDRSRSHFAAADAKLILDRSIATLPAGSLTSNLTLGISRVTVSNEGSAGATPDVSGGLRRSQADLRLSFAAPLTRRGHGALGDMSANIAIGSSKVSGAAFQWQADGGLTWSPAASVQFYGGYSFVQIVPDAAQLNGPRVETVVQIYDPIRQEVAHPVWIIGGNPDLRRGTRTNLVLKAMLRPLGGRTLTLDLGYQRQVARGGIAAFPQLTPAVENAFPGRITRDAAGQLIALDARPINIARDASAQITTGVTWLWSPATGRTPPPTIGGAPWQVSLTVNHTWQLESLLTIDPDLAPLDRLSGAGGQPRHLASLQLLVSRRGIGAMLNGQWQGASRIDNAAIADGQGDLRFAASAQFALSFFVEPDNLSRATGKAKGWASNLRISLDLQNLFDSYQRVTLAGGRIAPGYDRYALNPLGRTIQIAVRKRF